MVVGALAAIALVYVIAGYINSHLRYTVLGKVDPASGMRIQYTVSSHYRKIPIPESDISPERILDAWTYRPPKLPRAVQWVFATILRRKAPLSNTFPASWGPGTITQTSNQPGGAAAIDADGDGYPDLSFIRRFTTNLTQNRLRISGSPATWCTFTFPGRSPAQLRTYLLTIRPSNQSVVYQFAANDDPSAPTGVVEELMRIRDSIRITKTN
jgi:hypothetical protein